MPSVIDYGIFSRAVFKFAFKLLDLLFILLTFIITPYLEINTLS